MCQNPKVGKAKEQKDIDRHLPAGHACCIFNPSSFYINYFGAGLECCIFVSDGFSAKAWAEIPFLKLFQLCSRHHFPFLFTIPMDNVCGSLVKDVFSVPRCSDPKGSRMRLLGGPLRPTTFRSFDTAILILILIFVKLLVRGAPLKYLC